MRCSPLGFAALVYLCAPLILFFATFTPYWLAAPGVCVISVLLWRARPVRPWRVGVTVPHLILCMGLAAVFLWACSFLAPHARTWDWFKHFSVVNELANYSWPPINDENQTFLRYYLGFYMLPGLAAKLFGDRLGFAFIFAEAFAGLSISLALAIRKFAPRKPFAFLVAFLLFGGLDLVGYYVYVENPTLLGHKEWWAGAGGYIYHSVAANFIWAPQHILSALLALLLVVPGEGERMPPGIAILTFSAVAFWSPFAALGLLPIALAATWGQWKDAALDRGNMACAITVAVPVIAYLLADSSDIPSGFNRQAWNAGLLQYAAFVLLEFGLLAMALRLCGWERLRYTFVVLASLLVLPWFTVGLYNDLDMRASIPALALLAFAAASAVSEVRSLKVVPLAIVLSIGAAASVLEMIGRSQDGHIRWEDRSLRAGFLAEEARYATQYSAHLPHWTIRH